VPVVYILASPSLNASRRRAYSTISPYQQEKLSPTVSSMYFCRTRKSLSAIPCTSLVRTFKRRATAIEAHAWTDPFITWSRPSTSRTGVCTVYIGLHAYRCVLIAHPSSRSERARRQDGTVRFTASRCTGRRLAPRAMRCIAATVVQRRTDGRMGGLSVWGGSACEKNAVEIAVKESKIPRKRSDFLLYDAYLWNHSDHAAPKAVV